MTKRIFTAHFNGVATFTGTDWVTHLSAGEFLAEEDLLLVGAQLSAIVDAPNENDGFARADIEISQSGQIGQSGTILYARALDYWNTSPAGVQIIQENMIIVFPEKDRITLKEGDRVYLHIAGASKSAGTNIFGGSVRLFYTKGKV